MTRDTDALVSELRQSAGRRLSIRSRQEFSDLLDRAADAIARLTRDIGEARESVARLEKQAERDDRAMEQVITERDAAEDAVQWLDCELGGNGEYYFNTAEPDNCPCDPSSMARMIAERVQAALSAARAELAECRNRALEDAAVCAENEAFATERNNYATGNNDACKVIAIAIRALKEAPHE